MLTALLLTFLLGVLLILVAAGVTFGVVLHAMVVSNRLHPSIETGAPLAWRYSPLVPARLHRRLQTAVGLVYRSAPGPGDEPRGTRDEIVSTLVQQAAAVDGELVTVNRQQGPLRRAGLRRLRGEVRQIEQLAQRLQHQRAALARIEGATAGPADRRDTFAEMHVRLDLLADAHDELVAIEQASTATDPDAVLRRMTAPPPPTVAPLPPGRRAADGRRA